MARPVHSGESVVDGEMTLTSIRSVFEAVIFRAWQVLPHSYVPSWDIPHDIGWSRDLCCLLGAAEEARYPDPGHTTGTAAEILGIRPPGRAEVILRGGLAAASQRGCITSETVVRQQVASDCLSYMSFSYCL